MNKIATAVVLSGTTWLACCQPAPTVGGTEVPSGLDCEEDEVISFVGVDTLDCVHVEILWSEGVHECALRGEADWVSSSSDPAAYVVCYVD